jgi:formamidopyrimidine-DNA glycosylase
MPELPEVETVRRGLAPVMEGARVESVELRRAGLRFPFEAGFAERVAGRRVEALGRRAKYLLARLEGGLLLAMHLGMSGSFRIESPGERAETPGAFHHPRSEDRLHDHVLFHLASDAAPPARIVFNDPRRFGYMTLVPAAEMDAHPHFKGLGVEPVGEALTPEHLAPLFAGRLAPLKAVLLDQRVIAGLGNIYVCEALWRAKLHPARAAGTLVTKNGRPSARLADLTRHIHETIADAIEAGGSTLKDYRQADGSLGYFQHSFSVYDREGEPCPRLDCPGTVERIVQSGRSTFYCPRCQR